MLEGAQDRGLVGPGPLEAHLTHARAWADALGTAPESFLDLGSGAGVPGLALTLHWPTARAVLLDARQLAAAWIEAAAARLGVTARVEVVCERAEAAARESRYREAFPLVVARGFAGPAVTAECGSPFVTPGGRLSVSEPPGSDAARWPAAELSRLGLGPAAVVVAGEATFVMLAKTGTVEDRWPRRVGQPRHRPLWT